MSRLKSRGSGAGKGGGEAISTAARGPGGTLWDEGPVEEDEHVPLEHWGEVFDGTVWELMPGMDWHVYSSRIDEWIPVDGTEDDPLEGPEYRPISLPLDGPQMAFSNVQRGWPNVAVRLRELAEAVGGEMRVEVQNRRGLAGAITSSRYKVRYKGPEVNW